MRPPRPAAVEWSAAVGRDEAERFEETENMGKCTRQGCKAWGTGVTMLESGSATLCDEHRQEFDGDPTASDLCNEAIRLKCAEQRAIALVACLGDDESEIRHTEAVENIVKHRMACKAFIAEFMARPVPAVPEAAT